MALARVRDEAEWPDEIRDAAIEEFTGELEIRLPGTPGEYNPQTGEIDGGTPGTVILSRRPARAQQIRLPEESSSGQGWETSRRYRFQCEILPGDQPVTKGLNVRFFGGRDPELPKMVFQVIWATNSSHAAIRTLECQTEGARLGAVVP